MDDAGTVVVASALGYRIRDHGVHTALRELVGALGELGLDVRLNDWRASYRAGLTVVLTPGLFSGRFLRGAGARAVVYAHVTPETLRESLRFERAWMPLARGYLGGFYRRAPRVVAVSETVGEELERMGVAPEKISVIPNGIQLERYRQSSAPSLIEAVRQRGRPERPLVLGVGQVQARKGIDMFAAVAGLVRDCDFVWVGGRPFGALTKPAPLAAQPPNLRFAGRVSEAELVAHYQAADIFLFPSRQENFGQVVVEAAASGLPLVLSDLPAFRRNFAEAATLCRDLGEYAVIVQMLADEAAFRFERAAAARELSLRFTARSAAERLLALTPDVQAVHGADKATASDGARL